MDPCGWHKGGQEFGPCDRIKLINVGVSLGWPESWFSQSSRQAQGNIHAVVGLRALAAEVQ